MVTHGSAHINIHYFSHEQKVKAILCVSLLQSESTMCVCVYNGNKETTGGSTKS